MSGRNAELGQKVEIVAKKALKLNGKQYQTGDVISDSTIAFRTKQKLYRTGLVVTKEEFETKHNQYGRAVVEEVSVDEAPVEKVEEVAEVVSEEVADSEEVSDNVVDDKEQPELSEDRPRRGRPRSN